MTVPNIEPRPIPGTFPNPQRWWVYVQAGATETSLELLDRIGVVLKDLYEKGCAPKEGALLNDVYAVTLPTGERFLAYTFRGDLEGWAAALKCFATSASALLGRIEDGTFTVNDGRKYPLVECACRDLIQYPEPEKKRRKRKSKD